MPKASIAHEARATPLSVLVCATIDRGALRNNLGVLRRWAPRSRLMAVVKANAYGHGLEVAAHALVAADAFAVARVEEGLRLRSAGINSAIVLLEGVFDPEQLAAAARADFELVVHDASQIELLRAAPLGSTFKIWLKLDTGMNRLGFKGAAFEAALDALRSIRSVRAPVNLFTHLASADAPDLPTTADQIALFAKATAGLPGERSIANSAGLLGFAEAQADWVRPGLLLYGASPFAGTVGADYGLQPAMTLHSNLIAVKPVAAGEQVGYSGSWTAQRDTRLAVAAVGYGDGYPRSLPSGSPVLVNGERASLAGRVSMDMIGIDVTGLARAAEVGDPVTLWGAGLPVEEVAVWADAIPYELLCGISQRVAVAVV